MANFKVGNTQQQRLQKIWHFRLFVVLLSVINSWFTSVYWIGKNKVREKNFNKREVINRGVMRDDWMHVIMIRDPWIKIGEPPFKCIQGSLIIYDMHSIISGMIEYGETLNMEVENEGLKYLERLEQNNCPCNWSWRLSLPKSSSDEANFYSKHTQAADFVSFRRGSLASSILKNGWLTLFDLNLCLIVFENWMETLPSLKMSFAIGDLKRALTIERVSAL